METVLVIGGAVVLCLAIFMWGESKRVPPVLRLLGVEETERRAHPLGAAQQLAADEAAGEQMEDTSDPQT